MQDGWTALEQASISGHQKVVELLLGAEANPDLQNKVSTGQDSCVHANLNSKVVTLHSVNWELVPSHTCTSLVPRPVLLLPYFVLTIEWCVYGKVDTIRRMYIGGGAQAELFHAPHI